MSAAAQRRPLPPPTPKYAPDRILYLGAPFAARLPENGSITELMQDTGQNTGNLFIGDAIRRHLSTGSLSTVDELLRQTGVPRTIPRFAHLEQLDRTLIEERFDVIVIGAANFLHHQFDFGRWADFLESLRLPSIIIGLGAQAPNYDAPISVPDGTRRMLQIISERSRSLGVRGEFTAATLNRMGISNVRIIGCPSMYWTCEPLLHLKPRAATEHLAVSVNGSANVVQHSVDVKAAARVEAALARLSFERGYPYVLQNETELMAILFGASDACEPSLIGALMHRYELLDISPEAFIQFVRHNTRVYADTGEWLAALGPFDFVLGTRFHGCLSGLLAGVPCLTFVSDTRTREMCEWLSIPHVDVREVEAIDVRGFYDALDVEPLVSAYPRCYRNYVDFLDENRLDHRLTR